MVCIEGLNGKEFKELLSVRYCVSTDKNKPIFCGVLFYTRGGRLYAEAIDGYRLSIANMGCNTIDGIKFVVPSSSVVQVDKLVKIKSTVSIYVDDTKNRVRFVVDGVNVDSAIIPITELTNWFKLFPIEPVYKLSVNKKALLDALKSLRSIDTESKKPQLCIMTVNNDGLSLNIDTHPAKVEYVTCSSNCNIRMGFNLKYLYAMVNSIKDKEVVLEVVNPIKPLVHRGGSKWDLVMPVNIDS